MSIVPYPTFVFKPNEQYKPLNRIANLFFLRYTVINEKMK